MRILIDALSARTGGGVTYIKQILPALEALHTAHEFIVLLSSRYQQEILSTIPANIRVVTVDLPATPLIRRFIYLQTGLVSLLKKLKVDIFFAPAESAYWRIPTKFAILARNYSIYAMPRSFGSKWLQLIRYRVLRQLPVLITFKLANRVIFVSSDFAKEVSKQMHVDVSKTSVIHHGVSPIFFNPDLTPIDSLRLQSYFVMVSSINPHKNHETLIRAYSRLPESAPILLLVGKVLSSDTYTKLLAFIKSEKLENRVIFLGELPYDELPRVYRGAIATIMPSRLETFGHPLVEAMAARSPVIASNLTVCHEICGAAALYFDPDDTLALATSLREVWQNEALRERMINIGSQIAKTFSWQVCAQKLVDVFEELNN